MSRFILLSHLYTLNKKGMSKREKREILEYIQARLIVFIDGGRELLQLSISKWETLTDDQQTEISLYLIPNVQYIYIHTLYSTVHVFRLIRYGQMSMNISRN